MLYLFYTLASHLRRGRLVEHLAGLDDRLLADMGMNRGDVAALRF
jgi:uncharacterized protein YjiS (DUF1127 family)